jgi:hypothetical protein
MSYELSQLFAKRTLRVVKPEARSVIIEELAKGRSFAVSHARGIAISSGDIRMSVKSLDLITRVIW